MIPAGTALGCGKRFWHGASSRITSLCRSAVSIWTVRIRSGCRESICATWTVHGLEQARTLALRELSLGNELVYKPLFGSQGEGLLRIARMEDLPLMEQCQGIYYLQRFVDAGEGNWHDWRVFVIGGHAVA